LAFEDFGLHGAYDEGGDSFAVLDKRSACGIRQYTGEIVRFIDGIENNVLGRRALATRAPLMGGAPAARIVA